MSSDERNEPPFAADAQLIGRVEGTDAQEDASRFVLIENRILHGVCVAGTGVDYIVSRHDRLRIRATVRTRWIYNNNHLSAFADHIISPRAESEIGCVIPGPTMQRFDHDIVAAVFATN